MSGLAGTKTVRVDLTDPARPVLTANLALTNSSGSAVTTTERHTYTCDTDGSTLIHSEVEGSIVGTDGSSSSIAYSDTYSDGMISMVHGFGSGPNVSDVFTFDRVEDGSTRTVSGSNVVNSTGSTSTGTPVGTFATIRAHVLYSSSLDNQNHDAYLDDELGEVKSFYWELVGLE